MMSYMNGFAFQIEWGSAINWFSHDHTVNNIDDHHTVEGHPVENSCPLPRGNACIQVRGYEAWDFRWDNAQWIELVDILHKTTNFHESTWSWSTTSLRWNPLKDLWVAKSVGVTRFNDTMAWLKTVWNLGSKQDRAGTCVEEYGRTSMKES